MTRPVVGPALSSDPDDDLFDESWQAPKRTNRLTAVLVVALLVVGGFVGGVLAQKHHDSGILAATAGVRRAGARGGGGWRRVAVAGRRGAAAGSRPSAGGRRGTRTTAGPWSPAPSARSTTTPSRSPAHPARSCGSSCRGPRRSRRRGSAVSPSAPGVRLGLQGRRRQRHGDERDRPPSRRLIPDPRPPPRRVPGTLGKATARKVDDVAQQAMGSLARQVEEAVTTALGRVRPELAGADPLVRRSDRADFQSNVALASAKRVKARPAELAGELAEALQRRRRADRGRRGLRARLPQHHHHGRRRVAPARAAPGRRAARRRPPRAGQPRRRSTTRRRTSPRRCTSGTCARRSSATRWRGCSSYLGATVIRQNHLGDWGTQFGMLIQYLDEHPDARWRHSSCGEVDAGASTVSALDGLYRVARTEFDARPGVRRPGPGPGRRPAGRRRGDAGALARDRRRVRARRSGRSTAGSTCCWSRATSAGESFYNHVAARGASRSCSPRASRRTATARCVVRVRRGQGPRRPAGRADGAEARRRLRLRHHRPRRRCATASATSRPTGSSTSSTPGRRCTSA